MWGKIKVYFEIFDKGQLFLFKAVLLSFVRTVQIKKNLSCLFIIDTLQCVS